MLTANSSKVIVDIHRKTPKMRCALKGAYVFRFEYWLGDSISNGSNDNDYDAVVSIIRQVRARTSHERIQPQRERMSELKATTTSLVDGLIRQVSLEPVIEKVWQMLY